MAERASSGPRRLIVGLMSGTSVDAIDAALVEIRGTAPRVTARVLHHHERRWPAGLRGRILAIMAPASAPVAEVCDLNAVIAREFAAAAMDCLAEAGVPARRVTALASHGQTVCHLPGVGISNRKLKIENRKLGRGSTLQLGDPSVVAALTGIVTVGNFRPADMAAGGQGAPLVPWADAALLTDAAKSRCVQNIGGIANVTYLPAGGASSGAPVLAFDTGPGNMLMDAVVSLATGGRKRFDRGGRLAARGELDYPLFRELQSHPYFSQKPPKSTGRELFGAQLARELLDAGNWPLDTLLTTLAHLTAWSIADAYLQFLPALPVEVILCGGGADNPTLVGLLGEYLAALRAETPIALRRIEEFGIPNKSKEAASFALLAAATLDGVPSNVPSVTGAARPVVLGVVARP